MATAKTTEKGAKAPGTQTQRVDPLLQAAKAAFEGGNGWPERRAYRQKRHAEAVLERKAHRGKGLTDAERRDPVVQEHLNASANDILNYAKHPKQASTWVRDALDKTLNDSKKKAEERGLEFNPGAVTTNRGDAILLGIDAPSCRVIEDPESAVHVNGTFKLQIPFANFTAEAQKAMNQANTDEMGLTPFVVGPHRRDPNQKFKMHDRIETVIDARMVNPRVFGHGKVPNSDGKLVTNIVMGLQKTGVSDAEARDWLSSNPDARTTQWAYRRDLAEGELPPKLSDLLSGSAEEAQRALDECRGNVVDKECFGQPGTSVGFKAEALSNYFSSQIGEDTYRRRMDALENGRVPDKKEARGQVGIDKNGTVKVDAPMRANPIRGGMIAAGGITYMYENPKGPSKLAGRGLPIDEVSKSMTPGMGSGRGD